MLSQRFLVAVFLVAASATLRAADKDPVFTQSIQPLMSEFCFKCHSTEKHKGDVDLQQFSTTESIRKQPKIWQAVAEQLAINEMPPAKEPKQPSAAQKEQLASWVRDTLHSIGMQHAGDPGPVVLRRLSNAEYTYTIRDLTGVESLDPAREFPVDGAAGEGFTNTGQALVMSPTLFTKYLDAAKDIANHAVLLPDGIRFSSKTTRRDRTEESLAEIRQFYKNFTEPRAAIKNTQQGIVLETDGGGKIPLEKYFHALLKERAALEAGAKTTDALAQESGLNAKYMGILYKTLASKEPSPLLDRVRARWHTAKPEEAAAIANEIGEWQKALWKFNTVGHIGKLNGPKAWMEPATPLAARQDVKLKLPASADGKDVVVYLVAGDAGDGNENDLVEWKDAKLVASGRPAISLKDVRDICAEQAARRDRVIASAAKALDAAAEAAAANGNVDIAAIAQKHGVDADILQAWVTYLGVSAGGPTKVENHLGPVISNASNFEFIKGWGKGETPNIVANSSDKAVRIPGNMKPHSVAVHPSPKLQAAVGWQSPVAATFTIDGSVMRAHPECGNGIIWSVELRRGVTRQKLAGGEITDNKEKKFGPIKNIAIRPGDLVSLLIDPRNGDHSCDLTAVELALTSEGDKPAKWSLIEDISPDIAAGNPHADHLGNKDVWHFYSEPVGSAAPAVANVPAGSLLAKWQAAPNADEKSKIAVDIQKLLATGAPEGKDNPDALLFRQVTSLGGPLMAGMKASGKAPFDASKIAYGVDPALFGKNPKGDARDATSLCVRAPSVIEIRLPAELANGCELVATGTLDKDAAEGSVQLQALTTKPEGAMGLVAGNAAAGGPRGTWTEADKPLVYSSPILVNDGSAARKRIEAGFDDFRQVFPAALCYSKIVPVDEVVTLILFYRQDDQLSRLMLNDAEKAKLDKLWSEMHFVAQDALTLVDAFEQIWQFSTQDGDPKVLEPLREPIKKGAADFQQLLVNTQPRHIDALVKLADRAYRRPLTEAEGTELRTFYRKLREQELSHEEAIKLTIARILVAPAFLYRAEKPVAGKDSGPVSDFELANRLSYFLWSSMPDDELRATAAAGTLHNPEVLSAQTKRMLRDPRMRRMATEFGCSWLHIHGFDELGEKSDRHFPTFVALRGAMYEESIRFFENFFENDESVLNILDADYTFLNDALAKHYGIPNVNGAEWRRVDGVKKFARGGILGQATTLAKQSGASRTSPILRGNWVAEALLGDKLPRPPKDVPQLPEEAVEKMTVRQMIEKHTSDARCAGCHSRIDNYGFSLESFDAIGRYRDKDGDLAIDTHAKTLDGAQFEGINGLRQYLLTTKRDAFLRQFCKKLLGYSLGRAVQLSDESLLTEMQAQLKTNDYRIGVVIDKIVQSSQFKKIRAVKSEIED